jgi:hypothetical protein
MANSKALVIQSGVTKQIPDGDTLIVSTGIRSATGLGLTVTADTGSITMASATSFSSTATVTGALYANGGVDRSTAASLLIGTTNATAITIGSGGMTTTVAGNLSVSGTETVVGTTSFEDDVTIGNGVGVDRLIFNATSGRLSSVGVPDVLWIKEANHQFYVDASTTLNTVGGALTIFSATGGATAGAGAAGAGGAYTTNSGTGGAAGAGAGAAGAGGAYSITGGTGGAGTATGVAGVGGAMTITAGNAGADGGAGGASGGNLTIRAGDATGAGTDGTMSLGATNTSAIGIGASGVTTTVTGGLTQLTGAVSLSANAASSFTTSAGALTITAAAASTWSTGAGALTLNGTGGVNIQAAATTYMDFGVTAANRITIATGVELETTGTGMIDLPALFKIANTAVGALVTAPNLDTLTNGSNADALHTHSGVSASTVAIIGTTGEAIDAGELVAWDDAAGSPRIFKADSNGAGELVNVVGVAATTVGSAASLSVYVAGERPIPDAQWDAFPVVADVGKRAYLSTTAGNWTLTAPSTSGDWVLKTGIVTVGGTGAVKVAIQIGEGTLL